jgi:hypothetical protein
MKRTLKRIAPVKFGLILGIMYGALSLIIVPFFLLFSLMSFFVPQQSSSEMGHLAPALGFGNDSRLLYFSSGILRGHRRSDGDADGVGLQCHRGLAGRFRV